MHVLLHKLQNMILKWLQRQNGSTCHNIAAMSWHKCHSHPFSSYLLSPSKGKPFLQKPNQTKVLNVPCFSCPPPRVLPHAVVNSTMHATERRKTLSPFLLYEIFQRWSRACQRASSSIPSMVCVRSILYQRWVTHLVTAAQMPAFSLPPAEK